MKKLPTGLKSASRERALIIANGTVPRRAVVEALAKTASLVVCADGGANHARRLGIMPDIVLGDFDSLWPISRKFLSKAKFLPDKGQENTDLEKAIEYCILKKYTSVDIVGATGTRIDHSTGSLGCFKKYNDSIEIRMIDTIGTLTHINREVRFGTKAGEKISLIPLERCTGITTEGLLYSLSNESLELGVREGISNQATGASVYVHVKKGTLLLYRFNRW